MIAPIVVDRDTSAFAPSFRWPDCGCWFDSVASLPTGRRSRSRARRPGNAGLRCVAS